MAHGASSELDQIMCHTARRISRSIQETTKASDPLLQGLPQHQGVVHTASHSGEETLLDVALDVIVRGHEPWSRSETTEKKIFPAVLPIAIGRNSAGRCRCSDLARRITKANAQSSGTDLVFQMSSTIRCRKRRTAGQRLYTV